MCGRCWPPIAAAHGRRVYRESPPPPTLADRVAALWCADASSRAGVVVPDNCADVVLLLHPDGSVAEAMAVGPMTRPVSIPPRATLAMGVRFRPGWARAVLGVPAAAVRDVRTPLDTLPRRWASLASAGPGAADPLAWLSAEVAARTADAGPPPAVVQAALSALLAPTDGVRAVALATSLGVSRQHLARQFDEWVGLRPAFVRRVVRLERAWQAWCEAAPGHGARIAARYGYADQSHFVRDVQALRGTTPTAARAAMRAEDSVDPREDAGAPAPRRR